MHQASTPMLCFAAVFLSACTTQQWYGGTLAWQKNECIKLPDQAERKRCMESTQASYESYRAEADKAARRP